MDNVTPDALSLPGRTPEAIETAAMAYNDFERLRDPSHAEAWSTDAWLAAITARGFKCAPVEILVKEMAFAPWVARMHCNDGTIGELERRLIAGDDLSAFLMPRREGGELRLSLREAIFVAHKA